MTSSIPPHSKGERLTGIGAKPYAKMMAIKFHTILQRLHIYLFARNGVISSRELRLRQLCLQTVFAIFFLIIAGRLVHLGLQGNPEDKTVTYAKNFSAFARPDIVDRNGYLLATDVRVPSLYAEPNKISAPKEAFDRLVSLMPELNTPTFHKKLHSNSGFVWIKRQVLPEMRDKVLNLGIPAISYIYENQRFYPNANALSHILGFVNIDNAGGSGLEYYLDKNGLLDLKNAGFGHETQKLPPEKLTIDLPVQHALYDEMQAAMERYSARGSAAIVLDVQTSEVIAITSLPDFNPHNPGNPMDDGHFNRAISGVYEMGSVFKVFSLAMALDQGLTMNDSYDAREPMRYGRFTITDFHPENRILTLPEIFIHSSNIGTAKMALDMGRQSQKNFYKKLHLLDKLSTEIPGAGTPLYPKKWSKTATVTASYGHGLSVSLLQTAAAGAAIVNGGTYIPPTFFHRNKTDEKRPATQVIGSRASEMMRYLMRLNVIEGSGKQANIAGYRVGGKTGTAEKNIDGIYVGDKLRTSFLAAFPMDSPRYLVLVMLDEPQREKKWLTTVAGNNAAPTAGRIIDRIAPLLGVSPRHELLEPLLSKFPWQPVDPPLGVQNISHSIGNDTFTNETNE